MTVNFGGNPYYGGNQKSPLRSLLIVAPVVTALWAAHMGSSLGLKSAVHQKYGEVELVASQSAKIDKVKDAINQNFDSFENPKFIASDTVTMPENVSVESQTPLKRFFSAFFKTPPLDTQQISEVLRQGGVEKNLETSNAVISQNDVALHFQDGIMADPQGKKYLVVDYFAKQQQ